MKKLLHTLSILIIPTISFAQWQQVAQMNKPSGGHSTIQSGDTVYIIGGNSGDFKTYPEILTLNINNLTWGPTIKRDSLLEDPIAVKGDSAMYVTRGCNYDDNTNTAYGSTEIYIYKNGTWTTHVTQDTMMWNCAVKVGSKIIFAGGVKYFEQAGRIYTPNDSVIVFDELTQKWSTAKLSVPRSIVSAASDGEIAVFAGGIDGSGKASKVVDIYNSKTNTWSTDTLTFARAFMSAAYGGGKFLFAGGVDEKDVLYDHVDVYDGTKWTSTSFTDARCFYNMNPGIVTDSEIFFVGGGNWKFSLLASQFSDLADIYDIATGTWSVSVLPYNLGGASGFSKGDVAYVAGGFSFPPQTTRKAILKYNVAAGIRNLEPNQERKLVKIIDMLGRETEVKPNVILIYLYSDGSIEKTLRIE